MGTLNLVKIVDKDKTYTDKNGKQHCSVNYYVVVDQTYIAVRPCFSKGYTQLDMVCETRINGGANNEHKE